jgi:hypothetical protein
MKYVREYHSVRSVRFVGFLTATFFMALVIFGCQPKVTGAPRETLAPSERDELYQQFAVESGEALYSGDGVTVTAEYGIEVASWKLSLLADAYMEQSQMADILSVVDLTEDTEYYLAQLVTMENLQFEFRLSGDEDAITVDIRVPPDAGVLIVPRGCVINGVVRDVTLFHGSEPEPGRFLITAKTDDLDKLAFFDLRSDNISSIAWLLTIIEQDEQTMRDFMLAASFSVASAWGGVTVDDSFSAEAGMIMWVARQDDAAYLCFFNGSEEMIATDINVTALSGSLISDTYTIKALSGECTYILLGYNLAGIAVRLDDAVLYSEAGSGMNE